MQLSANFSLAEFTASATASARGIANVPGARAIAAMQTLCAELLEPVRAHYRRPVRITSGFRSVALCLAVGSSAGSQHALGEAGDFEVPGVDNYEVACWIRDTLRFDQLILENHVSGQPNSGWIHASYRAGRLRHECLTIMRRRTFAGLIA